MSSQIETPAPMINLTLHPGDVIQLIELLRQQVRESDEIWTLYWRRVEEEVVTQMTGQFNQIQGGE